LFRGQGEESYVSISEKVITGCLLGTAAGDSLGLPYEGLTAGRQLRMFREICGHRLFFDRGMISDDTEHACMVAMALISSRGDSKVFISSLARLLRRWLLFLPAGTGIATLRAGIRLLAGIPPSKSGVFSAGNGPCMRSAILGVLYGDEPARLSEMVRASTILTHRDPKAEYGAMAVATAASIAARIEEEVSPADFIAHLGEALPAEAREFHHLVEEVAESLARGEPTAVYAASRGLSRGITGYTYHTVPAVIHCWLRNQQHFERALLEIIRCGGDTDTTAAILGAIVGAHVGKEGIPAAWLDKILEWPCSVQYLSRLAHELYLVSTGAEGAKPQSLPFPSSPLRNLPFMLLVLLHGFRRLLPPY